MFKNLFTILIATPFLFFSQNYKEDLLSVGKNFSNLKNYSLVMNYQLFLDHNMNKSFQERKIDIKKQGNNIRIEQSSGLEMLENEKYQIVANNKTKELSVIKKEKGTSDSESLNLYSALSTNIDSVTRIYDKVKLIEKTADKVKYELIYKPNEQIEKLILVIDKKTQMYQSVTIFYKKPVKVNELDGKMHLVTLKISYNNFTANSIANSSLFSEGSFFILDKKGKVSPIKKYSGYELIIPQ